MSCPDAPAFPHNCPSLGTGRFTSNMLAITRHPMRQAILGVLLASAQEMWAGRQTAKTCWQWVHQVGGVVPYVKMAGHLHVWLQEHFCGTWGAGGMLRRNGAPCERCGLGAPHYSPRFIFPLPHPDNYRGDRKSGRNLRNADGSLVSRGSGLGLVQACCMRCTAFEAPCLSLPAWNGKAACPCARRCYQVHSSSLAAS